MKSETDVYIPIANALLREATGLSAGDARTLVPRLKPLHRVDPYALTFEAEFLAGLFSRTADYATKIGKLPQVVMPDDPRADLTRDLRRSYEELTGYPARTREPIEVSFDADFHPAPAADGGLRINLSFSARTSLRDVYGALRYVMSELRASEEGRQPKAVGERTINLVRFVTFHSPDTGWSERVTEWNDVHPQWAYADGREMYRAFAMAEYALLNSRSSLFYYFDSEWRNIVDAKDTQLSPRQRLRQKRRMEVYSRELLFMLFAQLDHPAVSSIAPSGVQPAVWKLRTAAYVCELIAETYRPAKEE